jgi:hypothetical protein
MSNAQPATVNGGALSLETRALLEREGMKMRLRSLWGAVVFALVSGAGCAKTELTPIATIEQIMETAVAPVSDKVFDAAVWVNGEQIGGPRTDEDWKMVEANALMLAETGNLLLMGSRMKDQVGWVTRTHAMMDAANEAAKAAAAKNIDGVFNAGTKIYQACTGCHLQYINPAVNPRAGH